MKQLSSKR